MEVTLFQRYIDDSRTQFNELFTYYGEVAGIWFDPEMAYFARPELFAIQETYDHIRVLQPYALIAFKQGVTGTRISPRLKVAVPRCWKDRFAPG